jgi:hypothetical protein
LYEANINTAPITIEEIMKMIFGFIKARIPGQAAGNSTLGRRVCAPRIDPSPRMCRCRVKFNSIRGRNAAASGSRFFAAAHRLGIRYDVALVPNSSEISPKWK